MTEDRLSRIENKLDRLADAVVQLARMEERMVSLFNRMDKYDDQQHRLTTRVDTVEKKVHSSGFKVQFAERIFWIVVTAAVSLVFFMMR
jgi:predicted  nucleic acid-binding Zn-ribbon protein